MTLTNEPYLSQLARWPASGRCILAQFDDASVVVYQAFRPAIGRFATTHGWFGGEFSLGRMSWIKPNFLWMMHRSGWGTKDGQETILAVRMRRDAFDALLAEAVPSTFARGSYADEAAWKEAVAGSSVRVQWDPDHDPAGAPQERRALQLGLRGPALARYAREWIVAIEDVTEFAHAQRAVPLDRLVTPREEVYPVTDPAVAARLGL